MWSCDQCGTHDNRRGRSRLCKSCYDSNRRERYQTARTNGAGSEDWWSLSRPPCELCGIKPRLKKRDRCEDCDPWCRQCGTEPRIAGSHYCHTCQSGRRREWYHADPQNRAARLASNKVGLEKLRSETFATYGGACECCGESEPAFLTIGHVNNDGAAHRREIGIYGGITFYRWLRDQGYPQDRYCLQCWNCNCGRESNGGICPHLTSDVLTPAPPTHVPPDTPDQPAASLAHPYPAVSSAPLPTCESA